MHAKRYGKKETNMKQRRDLRTQKTYDALIEAFQELLNEKSFDDITVRELCSKARTRTATFYSHFKDKYDFFYFMVRELRRNFTSDVETIYDKNDPSVFFSALLLRGMDFLEENKRLSNSIKSDAILRSICQEMPDEVTDELKKHLTKDIGDHSQFKNSEVILHFLIGGFSHIAEWWFMNQMKINKKEIVSDMERILDMFIKNCNISDEN